MHNILSQDASCIWFEYEICTNKWVHKCVQFSSFVLIFITLKQTKAGNNNKQWYACQAMPNIHSSLHPRNCYSIEEVAIVKEWNERIKYSRQSNISTDNFVRQIKISLLETWSDQTNFKRIQSSAKPKIRQSSNRILNLRTNSSTNTSDRKKMPIMEHSRFIYLIWPLFQLKINKSCNFVNQNQNLWKNRNPLGCDVAMWPFEMIFVRKSSVWEQTLANHYQCCI